MLKYAILFASTLGVALILGLHPLGAFGLFTLEVTLTCILFHKQVCRSTKEILTQFFVATFTIFPLLSFMVFLITDYPQHAHIQKTIDELIKLSLISLIIISLWKVWKVKVEHRKKIG